MNQPQELILHFNQRYSYRIVIYLLEGNEIINISSYNTQQVGRNSNNKLQR